MNAFGDLRRLAQGSRILALVTAGYLLPLVTAPAIAEEPAPAAIPAAALQPEPSAAAVAGSNNAGNVTTESTPKAEREPDPKQPLTDRSSVKFITDLKYLTPNRPGWLEMAPTYEGELYQVAVRAGPYRSIRDCEPDLARDVTAAVSQFINEHLHADHAAKFIQYSMKELRTRKVVREQFSEQLGTSVGPMSQLHALLVFDDDFRDELDERWSEIKSKGRLAQTGLGAGAVLLLLTTLFSFLKLDTVTKGYYTGRLQFGAAATILTVVAASVLLAKLIPWM